MELNPNHVLVVGCQQDAIRMGLALQSQGITVSHLTSLDEASAEVGTSADKSLGSVDLVLFGVNPDCAVGEAKRLAHRVPPDTPVVALLPGIRRLTWTARAAPGLQWVRCVIQRGSACHPSQGADRTLLSVTANRHMQRWRDSFERAGYAVDLRSDMLALQWGQTLLQLAALAVLASGHSMEDWLKTREGRTGLAGLWSEALDLLRLSGVEPVPMLGMSWRVASIMLKMGDAPFSWLAGRHFSALRADIEGLLATKGVPLELLIDASCGEVMRLAIGAGEDAPCAVRLAKQLNVLVRVVSSGQEVSLTRNL